MATGKKKSLNTRVSKMMCCLWIICRITPLNAHDTVCSTLSTLVFKHPALYLTSFFLFLEVSLLSLSFFLPLLPVEEIDWFLLFASFSWRSHFQKRSWGDKTKSLAAEVVSKSCACSYLFQQQDSQNLFDISAEKWIWACSRVVDYYLSKIQSLLRQQMSSGCHQSLRRP